MAVKNPIVIRQNLKLGELDAESDSVLLESCFIDSGYFEKLINTEDTASIIVGRTGAGKSALLQRVTSRVFRYKKLDPNDISIRFLEHSDIISFFEELEVNLDLFYKILWRHILIIEFIKIRHDIKNENDTDGLLSSFTGFLEKMTSKERHLSTSENGGINFGLILIHI